MILAADSSTSSEPMWLFAGIAVVLIVGAVVATFAERWERPRRARQAKVLDARIVEAQTAPEPEPDELVEDWSTVLPARVEAIAVPRVGVVHPVHYKCADFWFDRLPSQVCDDCLPVLRDKAVA